MKVIDYKKFQLSKLVYDKPIKIKGGCLMTKTSYKLDNQTIPIYIQTPKLKTLSGLVLNDSRSYIDLELDRNHLGFYEFITNLDEQNLTTTHSNSEEWFGQTLPMDVIDDFYNSPLKMSKLEKAPNVKFRVPTSKGRPLCEIFGENARPLEHNLVTKDTEVICILELVGVKYYKQRFECDWQVIQMRAFIDDYIPKTCLIDESLMTDFEKEPEVFSLTNNFQNNNVEEPTVEESNVEELNVAESNVEESNVEEPTLEESNVEEQNLKENNLEELNLGENNVEELNVEENNVEELNVEENNVESENLEQNSLEIENLNLSDDIEEDEEDSYLSDDFEGEGYNSSESLILEDDSIENLYDLSEGESLQSEDEDEISDLDENIEEVYLENDDQSDEEDLEEDIELDLEEVKLNVLNELDDLKNIENEKNEEVSKLKELGQSI